MHIFLDIFIPDVFVPDIFVSDISAMNIFVFFFWDVAYTTQS